MSAILESSERKQSRFPTAFATVIASDAAGMAERNGHECVKGILMKSEVLELGTRPHCDVDEANHLIDIFREPTSTYDRRGDNA